MNWIKKRLCEISCSNNKRRQSPDLETSFPKDFDAFNTNLRPALGAYRRNNKNFGNTLPEIQKKKTIFF